MKLLQCIVYKFKLIHEADPQSRPVVIIVFAHVVRLYVRTSVHPHFSKQNKFQENTMFVTGETVGLVGWIIDDACLVYPIFMYFFTSSTSTTSATTLLVASVVADYFNVQLKVFM